VKKSIHESKTLISSFGLELTLKSKLIIIESNQTRQNQLYIIIE